MMVDKFIKVVHFSPLKPRYTAKSIAEVFVSMVVELHGFPKVSLYDRDPLFVWKQLLTHSVTKLHYSSIYHPQSSQTAVIN